MKRENIFSKETSPSNFLLAILPIAKSSYRQGFKLQSATANAATISWFLESLKPHHNSNCGHINHIYLQFSTIRSQCSRNRGRNLKSWLYIVVVCGLGDWRWYPNNAEEILRFWPITMTSTPCVRIWERIVEALSLPSISTFNTRTRILGWETLQACFISSRKSMPSPSAAAPPPPRSREAVVELPREGILRKVERVLRHEVGFSTCKRINSSCSSTAWHSAYCNAPADSLVGSATTITLRATVLLLFLMLLLAAIN